MKTADGRVLGAGTDIGPEVICYRTDLFKAAGLPTDGPAAFAWVMQVALMSLAQGLRAAGC